MNYTVGDVVQLKSGGPVMVISEIGWSHAKCMWFDVDLKVRTAVFDHKTLQAANETP